MKSGVYRIRNTTNGKVYIGSTQHFPSRRRNHFSRLRKGIHDSVHLQRAFTKYGPEAFEWEIIETCNAEDLARREQHYIDQVPPGMLYNLRLVVDSNVGLKRSPECRARMSAMRKGRCFVTPEDIEKRSTDYPSLTSPSGIIYPEGRNISRFARENGLVATHLRGLIIGRQKSHRGWTLTAIPVG